MEHDAAMSGAFRVIICFVCYLQEVNVDFEAYSISDNDYDGIKKLLQQVLLFTPYS